MRSSSLPTSPTRLTATFIGAVVLTVAAAAPSYAAPADVQPSTGDAAFTEFIKTLGVSADTAASLQTEFDGLAGADQDEFVAAFKDDPASVIEYSESIEAVSAPAVQEDGRGARAATKTYLAANTQSASILGVAIATFTVELRYEASTTAVTRILSCNGWYSGLGVSSTVSVSKYISSSGRGTCDVLHRASVAFKGSPISFNKKHAIVTNNGKPSAFVATLSNV
jgi:hypothetical protein